MTVPAPFTARVATLAICGTILAACATHAPPSTTPILSSTAQNEISVALLAIQTAAITLGPVDGLSNADTTTIINTIGVANQTVQAGATGWLSAVDVLLAKLPGALSASAAATLQPYFDSLSALILVLYSSGVL
jgi:hypothetical protein